MTKFTTVMSSATQQIREAMRRSDRYQSMCHECGAECRGWCRAFTPAEAALAAAQAVLLVIFFIFLMFLILHFLHCSYDKSDILDAATNISKPGELHEADKEIVSAPSPAPPPPPPAHECTWTPSEKTTAGTRYFERGPPAVTAAKPEAGRGAPYVMALARARRPSGLAFGCTLTVITAHWTLTAASCVRAVAAANSLDSLVMVDGLSETTGGRHAVSAVALHPRHRHAGGAYDVAALRSEDELAGGADELPKLPTALDYLSTAIGERLTALGFGAFRSREEWSRGVRATAVHVLPCGAAGAGSAALCAGPLSARGRCGQCAGAPLLRARVLLGLAHGACGAACAPASYVNLAAVAGWLTAVLKD